MIYDQQSLLVQFLWVSFETLSPKMFDQNLLSSLFLVSVLIVLLASIDLPCSCVREVLRAKESLWGESL